MGNEQMELEGSLQLDSLWKGAITRSVCIYGIPQDKLDCALK